MSFLVHAPGTHSRLVDLGRPGWRSLGVPVGGAADRTAFVIGNALVGNGPGAVALEITLAGPTLEATANHACVLSGAPFQIFVNDRPRESGKTFRVRGGDILTIATADRGLRAYLCVPGGFAAKRVLGSCSAWAPVQSGQELICPPSTMRSRFLLAATWPAEDSPVLRALPGGHAGLFASGQFFGSEYAVTTESNRMGLRLDGPALLRAPEEMLSSPVCPGTVQITNDGRPVVLGVDAQTIGGYPQIAQVIWADLDRLAQLRPGDKVRFELTDMATAVELRRRKHAWLREWTTRLTASVCPERAMPSRTANSP
jgi:antagonist of KipI